MNRKTTEDYLKAIYQVEAEHRGARRLNTGGQSVSTNDLADRLGIAAASVTGMLKKLAAEDLVTYTPYQGVGLTEAGQRLALAVVRRHRLAERYLQDVLGLSWDQVHAEAEEWEHVLSDRVTTAMDEALGCPQTDPHGEPIPSTAGQLPPLSDAPLAQLHANDAATVARVGNEDGEFLRYLGGLGLYPDTHVVVVDVAPFDGPVTIDIGDHRGVIGRKAAEQVYVVDVHPSGRDA
jgi:DtxR family transcriptional regulator, Mn-dependent transcriptional regulator